MEQLIQKWIQKDSVVLLLFLMVSIILRVFTYFPSVINHDESTYIVIAQEILNGKMYWVDVIDTKPIGIFLLFAIIQKIFGAGYITIRIATSICIGLTAFFIWKTQQLLVDGNYRHLGGGLIYIIIVSFFTFYGLSPNTEHFFVLTTIIALHFILKSDQILNLILAGLLLGIGFVIKPVVLFDGIALGVLILLGSKKETNDFISRLGKATIVAVFASLPFIGVYLFYKSAGYNEEFLYYTFQASGAYLKSPPLTDYLAFIGDFFIRFLPVSVWYFVVLRSSLAAKTVQGKFILIWSVLIWIAMLLPGRFYSHYLIQFMLPFSLFAGMFFHQDLKKNDLWRLFIKSGMAKILLPLVLLTTLFIQKTDFVDNIDVPVEISNHISKNLNEGDVIFSEHQIMYSLLDRSSPTPYVHPSLLTVHVNSEPLGVNVTEAYRKIMDQKPKYVVLKKIPEDLLKDISLKYQTDTIIGGSFVFRRK